MSLQHFTFNNEHHYGPVALSVISSVSLSTLILIIQHIWQYITASHVTNLFIIILSARSNFELRQAIRDTWGDDISSYKNARYMFIVSQECLIPPSDRVYVSTCKEWNNTSIDLAHTDRWFSISSHTTNENVPNVLDDISLYSGFGFKVLHTSHLLSFGCHVKLLSAGKPVSAILRDAEKLVLQVNISRDSCHLIKDDFCYVHLRENSLLLPKGFEGEILLNGSVFLSPNSKKFLECSWDNGSSVIYTFGRSGKTFQTFDSSFCSLVSAQFSFPDSQSLLKHFDGKQDRRNEWKAEQVNISEKLKREMNSFNDIVILGDVTDVYRNLPHKLIRAFQWVQQNYRLKYVMKVDDDTYVNVKKFQDMIGQNFKEMDDVGPPEIFSHFVNHQIVPTFGKWADYEYHSITYPPYPYGAGYILSNSLLSLITEMSSHLRTYQGEDVTIGIWTETLIDHFGQQVSKREVDCWLPSRNCFEPYVIPNLTPEKLLSSHEVLGGHT